MYKVPYSKCRATRNVKVSISSTNRSSNAKNPTKDPSFNEFKRHPLLNHSNSSTITLIWPVTSFLTHFLILIPNPVVVHPVRALCAYQLNTTEPPPSNLYTNSSDNTH